MISQDAEARAAVVVGGTDRSGLIYDSTDHVWYTKNQAGTEALLVNGVSSFASRAGAVVPLQADYDAFYLTPVEGSAAYQALDSDLTAIAALVTTSFGRGFLDRADAATARTYMSLGTAALNATGDFQPIDSDLTAIAALSTTSFGRSILALADAAALTTNVNDATALLPGRLKAADFSKLSGVWKDAVTDGLCDSTGATNNTAQIQALQDAMSGGGVIYVPPNCTIRVDGPVNVTNQVRFVGGQRRTSKFVTNHATNDMFSVSADGVIFENLRFSTVADNAALRTGGYVANFLSSSDSSGMRCCDILFQWSTIQSTGGLQFFEDLNIREYGANAINGACILVNGSGDRYIRRVTTDNGSNPTGYAGIRVTQCASLVISDCNLIHAGTCLALEPGNGLTVPSIEAVNCFFDTSAKGMAITPTGTGVVYRSKFTNCWFGTHSTVGVEMNGTQWDGITFDNCDFLGSPIGINCPTGGGKWMVSNSRFAGAATAAINLVASAAHFPKIIGNDIGPQSAFGVNGTGIVVGAGAYKGLHIVSNGVVGNTTNINLGAVTLTVPATEGGSFRVVDNPGINPRNVNVAPAVPATNVAVTNNTGFHVSVYIIGGTLTTPFVTVGGIATGQTVVPGSNVPTRLAPGQSIALTFSAAPTWKWIAD